METLFFVCIGFYFVLAFLCFGMAVKTAIKNYKEEKGGK